ncbi:uncharacterized protein LOC113147229 [Cyclospora cayetanensis]|uniref:Uncharacterized protein LOC113147229 n=1 Tax=Cyclospora cayetanensis TaxID=88456 RepID=A0A6P6RZV8_9EIME|nr:uncharacterized protein LOC113147229 [Cyclospora cayetanensis]
MDYGMSCGWDSNSKAFVQAKAQRYIAFHPLASRKRDKEQQGQGSEDSEDQHKSIPSEELGLQPDGTIVLPGRDWMCIDAEHYFNITSLMNDSRSILDVHFEGFPYLVLLKKQGQELLHMEECLVNCGPLFRLGHLQPLCEAALYDEADEKPSFGTKASKLWMQARGVFAGREALKALQEALLRGRYEPMRLRGNAGAQALRDGLGGEA